MFYKMIENKCTQWYESDQCTVKNLIEYIKKNRADARHSDRGN